MRAAAASAAAQGSARLAVCATLIALAAAASVVMEVQGDPSSSTDSVEHIVSTLINGGLVRAPEPVPVVPGEAPAASIWLQEVEQAVAADNHRHDAKEFGQAQQGLAAAPVGALNPVRVLVELQQSKARAAAPSGADTMPQLSLQRRPSGAHPCKKGFRCPPDMIRGVCCKGGEVCCPERCINDGPKPRCGLTNAQYMKIERQRRVTMEMHWKQGASEAFSKKANAMVAQQKEQLQKQTKTEAAVKGKETQKEEKTKAEDVQRKRALETVAELKAKEAEQKKAAAVRESEQKRPAQKIALAESATTLGGEYLNPSFRVLDSVCFLGGALKLKSVKPGAVLFQLPAECRPAATAIFGARVDSAETARIDVRANGDAVWMAGPAQATWLSLEGVAFILSGKAANDLELAHPWKNYGEGYATAQYAKDGGFCIVQGVVRLPTEGVEAWGEWLATLPSECRPTTGWLVFNANHHQFTHRVDVRDEGRVLWVAGNKKHPWISLHGVAYMPKSSVRLPLGPGWRPYGNSWGAPRAAVHATHIVSLTGVATVSSPNANTMAVLPSTLRPSKRLVFGLNNGMQVHRFDVLPTGEIVYVDGPLGTDRGNATLWVSLDGMRFSIP